MAVLLDELVGGYHAFQPGDISIDNTTAGYTFIAIAIAANQGGGVAPTVTPPAGTILLDRDATEHGTGERQFLQIIESPPAGVLTWTISTPRAVEWAAWAGRGIIGDVGAPLHGYNADPAPVWPGVTVAARETVLGLNTWHGNNAGMASQDGVSPSSQVRPGWLIAGLRDNTPLTSGPTGTSGNFAGLLYPDGTPVSLIKNPYTPPGATGDIASQGVSFDSGGHLTTGDHGDPWSTVLFAVELTDCECEEFEYVHRWPQFYDALLSDDPARVRSAVALLCDRDRALEDHLDRRCCDGSASCVFDYSTEWNDIYTGLLSVEPVLVWRAVALLDHHDQELESHLADRPCYGVDLPSGASCLFDYPYRWPDLYGALLSARPAQVEMAVSLLEQRDIALEDHLRLRVCFG